MLPVALAVAGIFIVGVYLSYSRNWLKEMSGVWVATDEFCKSAGLSAAVLFIDKDISKGHLTMMRTGDNGLISNQNISMTGWGWWPYSNRFKRTLNIKYETSAVMPERVRIEVDTHHLRIMDGVTRVFEAQKVSSMTANTSATTSIKIKAH